MKALNPNTGNFEEVYVKALDSMPVGTIVDYDGQASDIPVGWETYGTGQIKKTSETRPLTASVVNEYSTSDKNAYSCDYDNEHFGETVLYNNVSGSNSSVALSDDVTNYNYIEIYFRSNDSNNNVSYTKIYLPNGKKTCLRYEIKVGSTIYVKLMEAQISTNTITLANGVGYYFNTGSGNTINGSTGSDIYIVRVVGYK